MNDIRITVLGATGKVGGLVVRAALARGLAVTALVRDAGRLAPDLAGAPGLTVLTGELDDPQLVGQALRHSAAVVSAVGLRYRRRHPWGGVEGRADVVPAVLRTVVEAIGRASEPAPKVLLLSAFGVGDSWRQLPAVVRWIISTSALKVSYAGLAEAEELLAAAGVPHTVVRPVTLTDGPATGRSADVTGQALRGNPKVSRADVAALLVDLALSPARAALVVAGPQQGRRA